MHDSEPRPLPRFIRGAACALGLGLTLGAPGCLTPPAPPAAPVPLTTPAPAPPGPPDLAAIATQLAALHPNQAPSRGGGEGPPLRGRVLDYRGHPIAGAQVSLCCQDDGAPWPVRHSGEDGAWSLDAGPANLHIQVLATGYARFAAMGPPWSNTGDTTLYRDLPQLAALAAQTQNPTDRVWLALEFASGGADSEDGPPDLDQPDYERRVLEGWRLTDLLRPELRQIATSPELLARAPDAVAGALARLRARGAPEDDPLVAALRRPPPEPLRAPTPEALCLAWTASWLGEDAPAAPPAALCAVRATDEAQSTAWLVLTWAPGDFGVELAAIARREGDAWVLLEIWEWKRWG